MSEKIVALAGGVGGAKLVYGLSQCVNPKNLTVVVNTADDFEHCGLFICPDLDTVVYTLAKINDPINGWGRQNDSFTVMSELIQYGGPSWFSLGDKDLGMHLERTRRLKAGDLLSDITKSFCDSLKIKVNVIPMSNQKISTKINTGDDRELSFQEYFVRYKCIPYVRNIWFEGIENAKPCEACVSAITNADLVIICPSNPWVSIDPILSIKGIRDVMGSKKVISVSPIIKGKAIKGPAAKIFSEKGIKPNASAVAEHYKGLIRGFVLDSLDFAEKEQINQKGIIPLATNTIMNTCEDKVRLAKEIIDFSLEIIN